MTTTNQRFFRNLEEPYQLKKQWVKDLQNCMVQKQTTIEHTKTNKKKLLKIDLREKLGEKVNDECKVKSNSKCNHRLKKYGFNDENPQFFKSMEERTNSLDKNKDFLLVFPEKIYYKRSRFR